MQLGDVAAIATVVALLILAYVHAKPAINRWATIRFLRIYSELHWDDLLTREQARELFWPRRLRRWRWNRSFRLVQRLMTRAHRIAQLELLEQLSAAVDRSELLPRPPDCDPLVVEAATVAKHEHEKRRARHRARMNASTGMWSASGVAAPDTANDGRTTTSPVAAASMEDGSARRTSRASTNLPESTTAACAIVRPDSRVSDILPTRQLVGPPPRPKPRVSPQTLRSRPRLSTSRRLSTNPNGPLRDALPRDPLGPRPCAAMQRQFRPLPELSRGPSSIGRAGRARGAMHSLAADRRILPVFTDPTPRTGSSTMGTTHRQIVDRTTRVHTITVGGTESPICKPTTKDRQSTPPPSAIELSQRRDRPWRFGKQSTCSQ